MDAATQRPRDWTFVIGAGATVLGAVLVLGREFLGGDISAGLTGAAMLMLGPVAMLRSHIAKYVSDSVGEDEPTLPDHLRDHPPSAWN